MTAGSCVRFEQVAVGLRAFTGGGGPGGPASDVEPGGQGSESGGSLEGKRSNSRMSLRSACLR